jgi:ribonuclease BN (tRNA processing enzyme)
LQALMVGRHMAAERTILTHFSQRYPKLPMFATDVTRTTVTAAAAAADADAAVAVAAADAASAQVAVTVANRDGHFSQLLRHPRASIAFDFQSMRFNRLLSLPRMLPAYAQLFPGEGDEIMRRDV